MAIDFSRAILRTKVLCSTVCFDGHEIENLISEDLTARGRGFLAGSFVRPPVEILLQLPCPASICCLQISAKVGSQQSLACTVFAQDEPPPSYDAFNHGVFRLVGNYEWSEAKKGVHLSGPGHGPQCKAVASDDLETHALSHRVATELLHRVWTVRIKIFKTSGCCIPAVQSLRAYGYVAHQCPDELARRVLTSWFRLQHPQRPPEAPPTVDPLEASSDDAPTDIDDWAVPDEFLDGLTYEVMALPVRLPSGNVVDQGTLERFSRQEASWGRPASDPFTGRPFNADRKPVYDTALKARIDGFLTLHGHRRCLQGVARTVGSVAASRPVQLRLPAAATAPAAPAAAALAPATARQKVADARRDLAPQTTLHGSVTMSDVAKPAVDPSRRWLSNLASAQRHVSRSHSTAVPTLAPVAAVPPASAPVIAAAAAACRCGTAGGGFYSLPCAHFICRPCLLVCRRCPECQEPFASHQPVRLHTGSSR